MILNGLELYFDVFDAEQGPTYMKHAEEIRRMCVAMQGNTSNDAEVLRNFIISICTATGNMLDDVFGPGTREKIFAGRNSLSIAINVYETMNSEVNRQKAAMNSRAACYGGAAVPFA